MIYISFTTERENEGRSVLPVKTKITDRPPPLNPPTTQPPRKEKFYSGERLEAGQKNHNMALATPVHIQIVCKQQNNWHLTLQIKSNQMNHKRENILLAPNILGLCKYNAVPKTCVSKPRLDHPVKQVQPKLKPLGQDGIQIRKHCLKPPPVPELS